MSTGSAVVEKHVPSQASRSDVNANELLNEELHELLADMFALSKKAPWCVNTILGMGLLVADIGDRKLISRARRITEHSRSEAARDEYQLLLEYESLIE